MLFDLLHEEVCIALSLIDLFSEAYMASVDCPLSIAWFIFQSSLQLKSKFVILTGNLSDRVDI